MAEQGPVMLAATTVLRGHKARIGKIGGNITLPRTVELATLGAGAAGAIVGFILAGIINTSFTSFLYGAAFGAGAGVFLVTYSPLQGESLLKWFGLTVGTKRQQVKIDGKPVRLAIGVAYLSEPARGAVKIRRGAVNVPPSQYDERGVIISAKNMNLPETLEGIMPARKSKDVVENPLPANADVSLETRSGKKAAAQAAGLEGAGGNAGKLKRAKEEGPRRTGRLAAARAAQQGLPAPAPTPWEGQGSMEMPADPFNQPLPPSAPGMPAATASTHYPPQVPAQGPAQGSVPDPFSEPPKRLPR